MDLSDGCELTSQVKTLNTAIDDFNELSSQGKPAALLTASDMSNYQLKVSIPPNGTTLVELHYQELLWQKLHKVAFQVPMFPGVAVDRLIMDISVEETNTGMIEFNVEDLVGETIDKMWGDNVWLAHFEGSQISKDSSLPRLLRAYYQPGPLPDDSLFLSDGECFTHLFNPTAFLSTVGSMARKIVFVIDVSGSMDGQKLDDAKASFAAMIETLEVRDTLLVQSFSSKGTEALWGPAAATPTNKASAHQFVMGLDSQGVTNLNQAYLDGISRVYQSADGVVPLLVILTDGQGNIGPKDVARNVLAANEGGKVKIFSLAFGNDADMNLLLGIAIQNGGRAVRIYEGFGDAVSQMEMFFRAELGMVMLSDVGVVYEGENLELTESTVSQFPVLADGSEIVVRGKIETSASSTTRDAEIPFLRTEVSALSAHGAQTWSAEHAIEPLQLIHPISECHQSFAQARIVELLEFRDAERALGNELFDSTASSPASSFVEQAKNIALDAGLVWPGLTAMVTVESLACAANSYEVCYGGDGEIDTASDDNYGYSGAGGAIAWMFLLGLGLLTLFASSLQVF